MKISGLALRHRHRRMDRRAVQAFAVMHFYLLLPFFFVVAHAAPNHSALSNERVQADVSTRTVEVTSSFTGTEIVVFGAIENMRRKDGEANQYDVVVVVEGVGSPLIMRRKSNIGGLWINTRAVRFDAIPSYYAISSTRPLDEITTSHILNLHAIGFEHISMIPTEIEERRADKKAELEAFKSAIIRLKRKQGLYVQDRFGTVFVGTSLFRASINLPANVPVGPLTARVHLFREGILLDTFESRVRLEREGLGRIVYTFAHGFPLLYGIFTVFIAAGAGWAASTYFSRRAS